jgi:hypothetical protein
MRVQRGAGTCYGPIYRGVVVYDELSRFGLVGHREGCWLAEWGGGEGERGPGGALVSQEQRGGAAAQYFSVE